MNCYQFEAICCYTGLAYNNLGVFCGECGEIKKARLYFILCNSLITENVHVL